MCRTWQVSCRFAPMYWELHLSHAMKVYDVIHMSRNWAAFAGHLTCFPFIWLAFGIFFASSAWKHRTWQVMWFTFHVVGHTRQFLVIKCYICIRMQHFGQNKELLVPPVNLFRSCHESRNVAYSKIFGVNDKNVHGSIGKMSINVWKNWERSVASSFTKNGWLQNFRRLKGCPSVF